MRAPRPARPSGGTSSNALVRCPGDPVKHGHQWYTGRGSRRTHAAHAAAVASSDATAYMALARELGAGYEAATNALAVARRAVRTRGAGECAYTVALEALGA